MRGSNECTIRLGEGRVTNNIFGASSPVADVVTAQTEIRDEVGLHELNNDNPELKEAQQFLLPTPNSICSSAVRTITVFSRLSDATAELKRPICRCPSKRANGSWKTSQPECPSLMGRTQVGWGSWLIPRLRADSSRSIQARNHRSTQLPPVRQPPRQNCLHLQ